MSESWFSNVDIDDVPDNPNVLPDNTYKFNITEAKVGPTKDKSKTGITFRYQIVEGAWSTFFPIVDWVRVPDAKTPREEIPRILSYIKMRLLAFGFSVEEIQNFGPKMIEQCVNRKFYGTTTVKKGKEGQQDQVRVNKFDPINGDSDTADLLDGVGSSDEPAF
jgi:hypothetical protein